MRRSHLSIGLFGGSFDPAHAGHLHVAATGLKVLELDKIWWMVAPQNPLKPTQPSYESRVETVKALDLPPRMHISHMERDFGTRYTIDTLKRARRHWPDTHFVFLMGADNFTQLPLWRRWEDIMKTVPIAVIARPDKGQTAIRARLGLAARRYRDYRIPEDQAHTLKHAPAPAWTFLTTPLNKLSSSAIRANRSGVTRSGVTRSGEIGSGKNGENSDR